MVKQDLLIRKARLVGQHKLQDIAIKDGIITGIADSLSDIAEKEIDAKGRLATPPFVDPHIHLDAALTVGSPRYNLSGTLIEGIQIWGEKKSDLNTHDVKTRALEAIKWEVVQGTQYIRTHVDICDPGLTALHALVEVKDEVKDYVDLQIVAFPQDGILRFSGGADLLEKALVSGADVVGGIPHHERTREDGLESIDIVFKLAKKYNKDIDLHTDETDDDHSRFAEYLAAKTIKEGFEGRVAAGHTTAMHSYNNPYAFKVIGLLKEAGISVITNPLDNIALQGRFDTYPKRRGLTRVKELLEAGVNVGIGHDSIMDPWYPLGKGSMLEAAFMCLNVTHMTGYEEMRQIFKALTYNSARILRLEGYGLEEGNPANLVILNANSEINALRQGAEALYVLKAGKIIGITEPAKRLFLGEEVKLEVPGIYE